MTIVNHKAQQGTIAHINISQGGVPKLSIPDAIVEVTGLQGDRQKNLKYHGGPDRALCLWSAEIIAELQAEGHPIAPGSTGENLTIEGFDWEEIAIGTQLQLGDNVVIEITDYAQPCRTIANTSPAENMAASARSATSAPATSMPASSSQAYCGKVTLWA